MARDKSILRRLFRKNNLPKFYSRRIRGNKIFSAIAGSLLFTILAILLLRARSSFEQSAWRLLFTGNKPDFLAMGGVLAAIGLLALALTIIYCFVDYRRHKKPLALEDPGVKYSLLHHAKAVFIPRASYYKKRTLLWSGYTAVLSVLLVAAVAVQLSRTYAYAPNEFVTTWDIQQPTKTLTIPSYSLGGYNYNIDWGDGNVDTGVTAAAYHTYASKGVYTVKISGTFPRMVLDSSNAGELITVDQWGNNPWATMESAFQDANRLTITASDAPDLSNVTSMANMFLGASQLNQPLNSWDVSNVTNMSQLFLGAYNFNQPLDNWDVSNVTNMHSMFKNAVTFDQPLNGWDVSSVVYGNFESMFSSAVSFNQPLDSWDVSNATILGRMFESAASFNQPLDGWNVSSVTNMSGMFRGATSFDQPLANWDVSSVQDMSAMFDSARVFDQPLASWNVSGVTDMRQMFASTHNFNQPLNGWDVSSVQDMSRMFSSTDAFNQPLNGWDVSSVTDMNSMFSYSQVFDQSINDWDVSNVTNMAGMFGSTSLFNSPLDQWNTGAVQTMESMFSGAVVFNQPIDSWDTSSVTNMAGMFSYTPAFNQPLNSWDTSSVTGESGVYYQYYGMDSMFQQAESFNQPLNNWDTSSVTNMSEMFFIAPLFNQPLNNWDVSSVKDMDYMFSRATNFNSSVAGWAWDNPVTMSSMFANASAFNQPVDDWDVSQVTAMDYMFINADVFDRSLGSWDVGNVTTMYRMLESTTGLSDLNYDLSLIGWLSHGVRSNVQLGAYNLMYCRAITARLTLVNDYNWSITDGGEGCEVPTISTTTADGTYGAGTVIPLQITFVTPVYVTGTPQLNLAHGPSAQYVSGSGTTVLTFAYTVSQGDNANQLDWLYFGPDSPFISLNGGTLKYQDVQDLSLDDRRWPVGGGLNLGTNHSIRIDTVLQTDFKLDISLPTPKPILSGSTVSSHVTITNQGPNDSFYGGGMFYVLPPGLTYSSNTNTDKVSCAFIGSGAESGEPYFAEVYSDNGLILCNSNDESTPLPIGQSVEFDIALSATIDIPDGSIFGGIYIDSDLETVVLDQYFEAYTNRQDFTLLSSNNVSRKTYTITDVEPPTTSYKCSDLTASIDKQTGNRTVPLTVKFKAKGQVLNTSIKSYLYDFGDGVSKDSTGASINHTYRKAGVFTAQVRIKTDKGITPATAVCKLTITVDRTPAAATTSVPTKTKSSDNVPTPEKFESLLRAGGDVDKLSNISTLASTRPGGVDLYSSTFMSLLLLLALAYALQAWREYRFVRDSKQAIAAAKQSAKRTQQFLEIISHYLNTPLAILQGAHELMTSKHALDSSFLIGFGHKLAALNTMVQGFEVSVQSALGQDGRTGFTDDDQKLLTKAGKLWISLLGIALAIAAIDLTLLFMGVYEKRGGRLVNAIILTLFSGLLIGALSFYLKRSKVLHNGINQEVSNMTTLAKQKADLLQTVAPSLQYHTDKLKQGTEGMSQLADAQTLVNGLAMLQQLTQELTSYQRLTQVEQASTVDVSMYYQQSIEPEIKRVAQAKGNTLKSYVAGNMLVSLRSDQLDYLMNAVIGNSLEYSPAGSEVVVRAQGQGKMVSISVTDNGPGISAESLSQLFEPLQRGTDTETFDHQGLGLSLFTAKHVIEQSGGTITVDSREGVGTSVKIRLPKARGEVDGQGSFVIKPVI